MAAKNLLAKTVTDNHHLVLVTTNSNKFDESYYSKEELAYVKGELKNKKKLITINQYKRTIFLQVLESDGKERYMQLEQFRRAGHQLAGMLNRLKATEVIIANDNLKEELLCMAEGMALANYQFLKYKTESDKNTLDVIGIKSKKVNADDLNQLNIIVEATTKARDLVNEPVVYLTSVQLAKEFEKMGKDANFKVSVMHKKEIQKLGMGGLLAVNLGSQDPPTFTVMEYKHHRPKNKKPIVLVGKGVVYDTGGLSLKPTANSMDYMKCDMGGAAAVGCAIYAIAKAKLPVHVIALVPSTDNRPGENAYVPGDVVKMYSGKTVEVLNTDAEGRMILADALHYAKQYKPELVMEFSTLTGSASSALGKYACAFLSTASGSLNKAAIKSGNNVYERMVEFPMWDEYGELIKSDVADIKNVGGPAAGMITAAKFLEHFVDYPYMHFDIAGTAFVHGEDSYRGKGGTGFGVRFIVDFIKNRN